MTKQVVIFAVLVICSSITAQNNLNASWLRHTCGYTNGVNLLGGNVWGNSVCADKMGNSYNSGNFSGYWFTMDTVIEMAENRFYINKYNSIGERLWTVGAKGATINSIMTSTRMKCDSLGNIYVCGTFSVEDSAYLAPYWYPVGSGIVAKYDSLGNNIWCKYIPRTGTTSVTFTDMALSNNFIYVVGYMGFGTQSYGNYNFNSTMSQNGVIAKLDFNGNILAAEQLDPNVVNEIHGIEVSKTTNDVYIVGEFINGNLNVDGQNLTETPGATNSFIVKMNGNLTALWAKKCVTYLHPNQTIGFGVKCLKRIELDHLDNIYTAANGNGDSTVIGTLKFNHRISPNGNYAQDIYIVKLDKNGNEIWLRYGGSNEMDFVNDIATDTWGNTVLAVGSGFQSSSGLIFGTDTIQQWYGGLVKYDPNGNLIYAKKLQEARYLNALEMAKDSVFYGTGTGFSPGMPYLNLSITQCEDTVNGYYNPPYKMTMIKFNHNVPIFENRIFVDSLNVNGLHNGQSWNSAYNRLEDALANANAGDTIWIAKGTYFPSYTNDRKLSFTINSGVALYGGFLKGDTSMLQRSINNLTILSGDIGILNDPLDNSFHVIKNNGQNVTLDMLSVIKGNANGPGTEANGGCVYNSGSLTLLNCILANGLATLSGNLIYNNGTLILNGGQYLIPANNNVSNIHSDVESAIVIFGNVQLKN